MEPTAIPDAAPEFMGNALTFSNTSDVVLAEIICSEVSDAILGSGARFAWDDALQLWTSPTQEIRFMGLKVTTGAVTICFLYVIDVVGTLRTIIAAIPVMDLRMRGAPAIAIEIAKYVQGEIHLTLANLHN